MIKITKFKHTADPETPWEKRSDYYHVYINTTKHLADLYEDPEPLNSIEMIPCTDVDNEVFKPGGKYYDLFGDSFDEYLCPERGNITYSGSSGTNLWVVPRSDPGTNYDIRTDATPFMDNFIEVHFISDYFDA